MRPVALIPVLLVIVSGCSSNTQTGVSGGGGAAGASGDAAIDAPEDVVEESASDTSIDVPADTEEDTSQDASQDVVPDATEPPSTFTPLGREPEDCPLSALLCSGWPSASDGQVWKYASRQQWNGKTFDRTYHVHVPSSLSGPAPVVVVLHGGTSSGTQMLAVSKWDDLGDPRGAEGIRWRKNTDACKAEPTEDLMPSYVSAGGASCNPPLVTYANSLAFVSVFPDGLLDGGETDELGPRHWEDGRVPSPGFDTDEEQRDDVGFIDHVIAQLLEDPDVDIDPSAVFVTGGSNGGMMTHRLACHFGDDRFPALGRVAAFQATIAEMPEGLFEGLHGREACPSQAGGRFALQLVLGTDIDTPDCTSYPCSSPTVAGDGLMPFGEAGGRHAVYSPDLGRVLAGPDTIAFWGTAIPAAMAESGSTMTDAIGFFTQRTTTTFAGSVARYESWVTTGGGHMMGASRMDFAPVGGGWAFLSSFRRDGTGTLMHVEPIWLTGSY
jgi:poly(3-hydroxybutyrate) depolymerase